jgi:hypothetical protein
MTSGQFVEFIEDKLSENGVTKVLPNTDVMVEHARRLLERRLAADLVKKMTVEIAARAQSVKLPPDLSDIIDAELREHPDLAWDAAVATVIQDLDLTA